jgi:hypothetical protein
MPNDPVTLRHANRLEQFRINTNLVDPFRSLAEHGRVQVPTEPRIDEPHENNSLAANGQGLGAESQWEDHPLLMNDPRLCSPDANNSPLSNVVPLEILDQVIEGRGSMPAAQLKLELENKLRAQMQKQLQLGLNRTHGYSTPTLNR